MMDILKDAFIKKMHSSGAVSEFSSQS
jgi:hypothetical protein